MRAIVGTVRDAFSHKPLPGVVVSSEKFAGSAVLGDRVLSTQTDQQGHFRLAGMTRGPQTLIAVFPPSGHPYFPRRVTVPDRTDTEAAPLEIELEPGIWISGRVIDKLDRKPRLAQIFYWPLRTNSFATHRAEFTNPHRPLLYNCTETDGTFRVLGVLGPAVIGAECSSGDYLHGIGFANLKMVAPDRYGTLQGVVFNNNDANTPNSSFPNTIKEIDPPSATAADVGDLALDPGKSLEIAVLGPDGKPVKPYLWWSTWRVPKELCNTPTFRLAGLKQSDQRMVLIYEPQRHLGKVTRIRFEKATPHSMTVRLDACGTLVGRAVNEDGVPLEGATLQLQPADQLNPNPVHSTYLPPTTTDSAGHFLHEGILPGVDYQISFGFHSYATYLPKRLSVEPGKRVDLGDVKVTTR